MSPPTLSRSHCMLLLAVAVLGTWLTRVPLMTADLWNLDEGSTITMAQQVRSGDVLYRDATDHRSPLVPYLKAAVLVVAGDWNLRAVQHALYLALGLAGFGMAWIAGRLLGRAGAWATLATYLALQILWADVAESMATNTEWFLILFSTLGFVLLVGSRERPSGWRGLGSGLCFGAAIMCKQPGLLDGVVLLVLSALLFWRSPADQRRGWVRFGMGALVGMALPALGFAVYFAAHGAWADYVYYAFTFNTQLYVPEVPLAERLLAGRVPFLLAWQHLPLLGAFIVGAAGVMLLRAGQDVFQPRATPLPLALWLGLGWSFAGLLSTTLSGREFHHYSFQALPGLCLITGWGVQRWWDWRRPPHWPRRILLAGTAAGLLLAGLRYQEAYAQTRSRDTESLSVALKAREFSHDGERLFVWGYYPEFYYLTQRLPASRFIYTNFVTGLIPWTNLDPLRDVRYAQVPGAQTALEADLTQRPPGVIIDTDIMRGHARFPLEENEWLWSYVQNHYVEVATDEASHDRMRVFRRHRDTPLAHPGPPPDYAMDDIGQELWLTGYHSRRPHSVPQLALRGEAGFVDLTLWDSDTPLYTVDHPPERVVEMKLFAPAAHRESNDLWVRGRRTDGRIVDTPLCFFANYHQSWVHPVPPIVPLVLTEHAQIMPANVSARNTTFYDKRHRDAVWGFHAPARLTWDLPPGLEAIAFTHGHAANSMFVSDGYDLTVNFHPHGAEATTPLLLRRLAAYREGKDQLPQHEQLDFTNPTGGTLELLLTNGPRAEANADVVYLRDLRWVAPPHPTRPWLETNQGLRWPNPAIEAARTQREGRGYWVLHAPNTLSWDLPAGIDLFAFGYGIDDAAYDTARGHHSDGVQFRVHYQASADAPSQELWSRWLRPGHEPGDRGPQHSTIALPSDEGGRISLQIDPGPHGDTGWDWSYAGQFAGRVAAPLIHLSSGSELWPVETSGFQDGRATLQPNGTWATHAPAEISYPKPYELAEVRLQIGLNPAAVRDESGARRSDGIRVTVLFEEWDSPGLREILLQRTLDPFVHPDETGLATLTSPTAPDRRGRLHVQIDAGPLDNNAYDWVVLGEFEGHEP